MGTEGGNEEKKEKRNGLACLLFVCAKTNQPPLATKRDTVHDMTKRCQKGACFIPRLNSASHQTKTHNPHQIVLFFLSFFGFDLI